MKFGEPGETRTHGPRIKSALRYQLRHRLKWCGRWDSNPQLTKSTDFPTTLGYDFPSHLNRCCSLDYVFSISLLT